MHSAIIVLVCFSSILATKEVWGQATIDEECVKEMIQNRPSNFGPVAIITEQILMQCGRKNGIPLYCMYSTVEHKIPECPN